jgi:hypothetical protein
MWRADESGRPRISEGDHDPVVVGKSITTNPGYFSSGRFLNGEGVKRLLFSQLGSLIKN